MLKTTPARRNLILIPDPGSMSLASTGLMHLINIYGSPVL